MIHKLIGDTETTDSSADARVCELAWIEVDDDLNEVGRQHSLIDPQRRISAGAMGVHNITEEMVASAPTIDEFFTQVIDPPLTGSVILIAHKVDFDRRMLEPTLERYGHPLVGQLCTLRLARKYLKDAENHKLSTLAYQYGLDRGDSHRADGDVRTCFSLLRFIITLSGKTLTDLILEDGDPLIVETMPFGKHKGVAIKDVPRDYVTWALGPKGLTEIDPDLKHTLQLRLENRL
jgi:exodeoxyribonuclease X